MRTKIGIACLLGALVACTDADDETAPPERVAQVQQPAVAVPGTLYFSQDNNPTGLFSIDLTTFVATPVGAAITGVNNATVGLAYDPFDDLLRGSAPSGLHAIQGDGSGFVQTAAIVGAEGLAFNPVDALLYRTINGVFEAVDKNTGVTVAVLPTVGIDLECLAIDVENQTIYALGQGSDLLLAYDIVGGVWGSVGTTSIGSWPLCGMAYDNINDTLWASSALFGDVLASIDPNTALTTPVGSTGVQLTGGMTFAAVPNGVTINEVRPEEPGADNNEYFELTGPPGTPLTGLHFLAVGDPDGQIEAAVSLDGQVIGASGFFVAAEASFAIGTADLTVNLNFENSDNHTYFLVAGYDGATTDIDANNDCVQDATPWVAVVDEIARVEDLVAGDCIYSANTVGPDSDTTVPEHFYRCADGDGVWVIGQDDIALGTDTPGAANAPCGMIGDNCNADSDCISTFCADGVCCDTDCGMGALGDCQACNLAGLEGTCSDEPNNTACGDTSATACTAPDTCDGMGTCLANHVMQGAACGDQNVACQNDDACDGMGMCSDNGPSTQGTPCGDNTDDECTDPDSCDGAGSCQDNHAMAGAACGDQGVDCNVDDACDGAGVCTDSGFEPAGTDCDNSMGSCDDMGMCDPDGMGGGGGGGAGGAGGAGVGGAGGGGGAANGSGGGGATASGSGGSSSSGSGSGSTSSGSSGGDGTDSDSGCGCEVAGGGRERPSRWLALLALGGLAIMRRRRRP